MVPIGSIRDRLDSYLHVVGSEKVKWRALLILMATTWFVWVARNKLGFNGKAVSVGGVVDKIKVNSFQWLKYRAKSREVV